MSIGLTPTKAQVDAMAGSLVVTLHGTLLRVLQFKYFLDGKTDQDLLDLGYLSGEVATLRSAFSDLNLLASIYQGTAALAVAQDFRTFVKRLMGMGSL